MPSEADSTSLGATPVRNVFLSSRSPWAMTVLSTSAAMRQRDVTGLGAG